MVHFDLRGLDFTNKCKKDLWVRIDDDWKKATPGQTIFGDTDGVCEGPDANGECRTFKWIDCYDAYADCADDGKMNEPKLTYVGNKHASGRELKRKVCCFFEATAAKAQEEQGGWRGANEFGEKVDGCK